MTLNKSLFFESIKALSKAEVSASSAYSMPKELVKQLSNTGQEDALVRDAVITAYKRNEFNIKIGVASEPNFDKFVSILTTSFDNPQNPIFSGDSTIQKKLAGLVSLAYFYAQTNPDQRYKVYNDFEKAQQVAQAIYASLLSTVKMTFLTYSPNFVVKLEKAICGAVFYDNGKKKEGEAEQPATPIQAPA